MDIFFDEGQLPPPGSMLVQKALGATLRKLADAETGDSTAVTPVQSGLRRNRAVEAPQRARYCADVG